MISLPKNREMLIEINYLCKLIRKYEIRQSYIGGFINDLLTTFDDLDKDLDNLELKK